MKHTSIWLELQFFAEGGEGAPSGEGMGSDPGVTHGVAGREGGYGGPGEEHPGAKEAMTHTDGSAAGEGGAEGTSHAQSPEEAEEEFRRLTAKDGKFRDAYQKAVSEIVRSRFKNERRREPTEAEQAEKAAVADILRELGRQYGISGGSAVDIARAFSGDEARLSEEAIHRGMSVEELRRVREVERELDRYRERDRQAQEQEAENARRQAADDRARAAQRRYDGWVTQGKALTSVYPDFSLEAEAKNPEFVKALNAGFSVQSAFEMVHHKDIVSRVRADTESRVEKSTADKIRAGAARPTEGAAENRTPARHTVDASTMTREELLAELERRRSR